MIDVLKVSVSEARKPEEESSFWKISSERSKLEREQSDFQSLTPSQIKSLEKGEKPLPSYLRQVRREPHQMENSVRYPRSIFQRFPRSSLPSLSSLRTLSLQTLILPLLRSPNPPSRERPSPRLLSPLQPPPSAPLQHPSPSRRTRPRWSVSPPPAEAGSALRAPCHRSATLWMRCSPPTSCPSLPVPPPMWKKRRMMTDFPQAPPFPR